MTLRRTLIEPETLTGVGVPGQDRWGSLMGNTTAEMIPANERTRVLVVGEYDGFVDVVAAALRCGCADGEISDRATPEAMAQMVLLLFQGSAWVTRAGRPAAPWEAPPVTALPAVRAGPGSRGQTVHK